MPSIQAQLAILIGHATLQTSPDARHEPGYLYKVLQSLARAGLVNSQRGLHGGYTLTRRADEVSVLDVINAVDVIQRINKCPLGLPSHSECLCSLHQELDDAIRTIEKTFAQITIADLMNVPSHRRPFGMSTPNNSGPDDQSPSGRAATNGHR